MTDEGHPKPEGDEAAAAEAPVSEAPVTETPVEAAEPATAASDAVSESTEAPTTEAPATDGPATDAAPAAPGAEAPAAAAPAGAAPADAAAAVQQAAEGAAPARRRGRRDVAHGQAHIRASFNNTIISITDLEGNSLAWTSGGSVGFKGSRKSTPYAAQVAAEQAARRAGEFGVRKLDVIVRGSGAGRETAVRTLQNMGMEVTGIVDITPTPHNGCRPKKKRRG